MLDKRREPFGLRRKEFWGVEIARKLVEPKFVNSLTHEPDGLIFQPALDVSSSIASCYFLIRSIDLVNEKFNHWSMRNK